jgi:transcriptional regulator with XRE-family HTH domain
MAKKNTTFGRELKQLRLEARIGLRAFARLIDMAPSNLSNIERERIAPPAGRSKIDEICDALGLGNRDTRRELMYDLAAADAGRIPADISEAIHKNPGIPVLVRTVAGKRMNEKKIKDLAEYIKKYY